MGRYFRNLQAQKQNRSNYATIFRPFPYRSIDGVHRPNPNPIQESIVGGDFIQTPEKLTITKPILQYANRSINRLEPQDNRSIDGVYKPTLPSPRETVITDIPTVKPTPEPKPSSLPSYSTVQEIPINRLEPQDNRSIDGVYKPKSNRLYIELINTFFLFVIVVFIILIYIKKT